MGVKETGDESEKLKGKQEMKRIGGDANGSPSSSCPPCGGEAREPRVSSAPRGVRVRAGCAAGRTRQPAPRRDFQGLGSVLGDGQHVDPSVSESQTLQPVFAVDHCALWLTSRKCEPHKCFRTLELGSLSLLFVGLLQCGYKCPADDDRGAQRVA